MGSGLKGVEKLEFWLGFEPQIFLETKKIEYEYQKNIMAMSGIRPRDHLFAKEVPYHCATEHPKFAQYEQVELKWTSSNLILSLTRLLAGSKSV